MRSKSLKIGIAVIALIVGFFAVTSSVVDGVDGNCPTGTACARPWRKIVMPLFSFEARTVSHEQFDTLQVLLASLSIASLAVVAIGACKTGTSKQS